MVYWSFILIIISCNIYIRNSIHNWEVILLKKIWKKYPYQTQSIRKTTYEIRYFFRSYNFFKQLSDQNHRYIEKYILNFFRKIHLFRPLCKGISEEINTQLSKKVVFSFSKFSRTWTFFFNKNLYIYSYPYFIL